ncbi:TBC1 domain family member 12 [Trichinella murrelli]|uniref:TBC1 domain family member 12 n=1 Tax=Trichinella murrelli TaxID=144512 RepID=A0A0V0T847_9BILA|nr:TBC1 domain family member 12 [Trichinella murrelli]
MNFYFSTKKLMLEYHFIPKRVRCIYRALRPVVVAPLCSTTTPVVAFCDESDDKLQASCLHNVAAFKDSGLHLDSSESDELVHVLHSNDQLVCFSPFNPRASRHFTLSGAQLVSSILIVSVLSFVVVSCIIINRFVKTTDIIADEQFATESVTSSLMPAANRGHVRHWSYDPAAARILTQEEFYLINTTNINNNSQVQLERRNSLGKTTDISSSSISISSLSHSDYSTSLASFSDEAGCSSSNGSTSKHSSLDRRSFCSDSGNNNTAPTIQTDSKDRLKLFSQFLPRNLFLCKNNNTNEGSAWKLFTKLSISTSSTPEAPQVISTTALILEERPSSLPPKSACEQNRQKQEYALMVEKAKKKEQRDLKQRRREMKEQLKREEQLVTFVKEWSQEILPRWNELKSCKRVKDLWGKGLPPCIRGKVWKLAIANELNVTEDLFYICLHRAKDRRSQYNKECDDKSTSSGEGIFGGSADCSSIQQQQFNVENGQDGREDDIVPVNRESTVELIHLDVARTFPTLGIFQIGGPFYDLLLNMLSAYVCYRPDIGYVQGMSFIAAILLLNLDLVDAFIAFCNLLNRPALMSFFRLQQDKMERYFTAYDVYFKLALPKLHEHFNNLDISPNLYLIDWLYTIYAKSLPLEITCRIWDLFLRDGDRYLYDAALGILCMYEDILLQMDFDRSVQFLTHLPDKIQANNLFKRIDQVKASVDKERHIFNSILDD